MELPSPADLAAFAMLGSLLLYAVLGGADFGGGVWDVFASGPRAAQQRKLLESAMAPVWEANHVWLILVVVLLFTAFPAAFAAASIALHVPLTLLLLGIVARGSAFAIRQYGRMTRRAAHRWGRLFAIASLVTPLFLGATLGAITAGTIRVATDAHAGLVVSGGWFRPWLAPFPCAVGGLTLALFAFLAAVFVRLETEERALREDFRRRALVSLAAVVLLALVAGLLARSGAPRFAESFGSGLLALPLTLAAASAVAGTAWLLVRRRDRAARAGAIAIAALLVGGWGLAQRPFLIAPDVTIANAAAPDATLRLLLGVLAAGALVLIPCLYVLFRVFKGSGKDDAHEGH
jgi:cytochrome d ubiquinol oxidase subunit II